MFGLPFIIYFRNTTYFLQHCFGSKSNDQFTRSWLCLDRTGEDRANYSFPVHHLRHLYVYCGADSNGRAFRHCYELGCLYCCLGSFRNSSLLWLLGKHSFECLVKVVHQYLLSVDTAAQHFPSKRPCNSHPGGDHGPLYIFGMLHTIRFSI